MPPVFFLQRPLRWLQAMTRYRATHSAAPNFAYDLCVRKTTAEQRAALDLREWAVAVNGAEPVRRETMAGFAEAFAPSGFRPSSFCPGYGLAEATLKVCASQRAEAPVFYRVESAALERHREIAAPQTGPATRTLVGCGRAAPETHIAVVRPETRERCGAGEVGEIWVSGPGVAQGYWNKPDETEKTFGARLKGTAEGPFLRTGDLGFLRDGELFITGRLKDLIIIGGHNHYPHDLEQTAERSHPALRPGCCAAFTIAADGEEHLVIAGEVERHYKPEQGRPGAVSAPGRRPSADDRREIQTAVRRAVAEEHDLQVRAVVLLKAGAVSKTSSGKLQRHACRDAFLNGTIGTFGREAEAEAQTSVV
jgi:acyl-CoA synthetase (AMP-forming)/AMP-acid ligase II